MPEAVGTTLDDVGRGTSRGSGGVRGRRVVVDPASTSAVAPAEPLERPATGPRSAWRRAGLVFAIGLAVLTGIYLDTVLDLWDGWGRSGTFAHGYIIFPVSVWLIWRLRHRLVLLVPKAQPLALLPMVGCGLLWLVGHSAGVHAPEQYAFVAMVPCLVWAVFGNEVTRRILYPLAFLFFAVPAGDFLMPTLMDHTADFTVAALRFSGVPVFREGNYFTIPSGSWSVVEACSGLRYLIASITLGFLFAYLNYRGAWRRAAFIVASIIVPIVANWLRAYLIVMLAHLSSNKLATGVDHLIYGWLFFGVVMMLLFWVGNFWRDDESLEPLPSSLPSSLPSEQVDGGATVVSGLRGFAFVMAAAIMVVAPWPALGNRLERIADGAVPGPIAVDRVAGWEAGGAPFTSFVPHYLRARSVENEVFVAGDRKVALFIGYYSGQLDNGPLVTYDNDVAIVADKVWGTTARRSRDVFVDTAANGATFEVVESEVKGNTERGDERLLTWRWYWINGRLTTSGYLAKAYNAFDKLTGRGDDSAVIVVTTPMDGSLDSAANGPDAAALQAFVTAAQPQIQARLAAIRAEAHR